MLSRIFPSMEVDDLAVDAWAVALEDFTEEEIVKGAKTLLQHHRHGAPAPAHLIEAILGRQVKVPRYATDNWNRVILPRRVEGYDLVRVPLGEPDPVLLDDGLTEHTPLPPAVLDNDDVTEGGLDGQFEGLLAPPDGVR